MAKGIGTGNITSDIKEAIEALNLVDIDTEVGDNDEFLVIDISTGELKKILSSNIVGSGGGSIDANPVGMPALWFTDTAPTDHVLLENQDLSRVAYPELFALWGTSFGNGDGTTTFGTPKVEDRFIRILGSGGGVDAASRTDRGDGTTGDEVGTLQEDAILDHGHNFQVGSTASGFPHLNSQNQIALADNAGGRNLKSSSAGSQDIISSPQTLAGASVNKSTETRPKNIYARMIVRYQKASVNNIVVTKKVTVSAGASDEGGVATLGSDGKLDSSMLPDSGGSGSSVFSFCQVRNTDETTLINTSSPSNIPFGGTTDKADADYTLASDNIICNFDGVINVQAHISQFGTVVRSNVGIVITKNNTIVSGVGMSGYIRAGTGHDESSSHISATLDVSDGDIIRVTGQRKGAGGTVVQIAGQSQITIERRS